MPKIVVAQSPKGELAELSCEVESSRNLRLAEFDGDYHVGEHSGHVIADVADSGAIDVDETNDASFVVDHHLTRMQVTVEDTGPGFERPRGARARDGRGSRSDAG